MPLPKVLHLASDTFKGGAESVFRNTIEATLESKQFDIYVASCDRLSPCGIESAQFLRLDDWQLYPKWRGAYKYVFNLANYKRLKAFLFTIKPDIIHTQNYLSRLSPSVLFALRAYKAKHPNTKLIYTQHGFGPCANGGLYNYAKGQICEQCIGHSKGLRIAYKNCDRRGRIYSILKALRSPFYQGAFLQEKELFDTIICVGEFQRQKHIQDGWDSSKLITLTNPIETKFYNPHISLADKRDLLVFFGRLAPEKNVPLLLRAFANLIKIPRFSHYKLLIIGDGDDKPKCIELARELIPQASPNATILESTFSKVDSVLGIHSDDLAKFRATADRKSCSTLNFAKSPTSNTAIPRIFEEKQARRELSSRADEALFPSSRDLQQHGVAIQSLESTFEKVDSRNALFASATSMDCHADKSARDDSELDSSVDRHAEHNACNDDKNAMSKKVDSTFETMDCHANASALARNDDKAQNLNESAQDSRSFTQNAQNLSKQQAEAVEMRNRCFLKKHRLTPSGIPCFQAVGAGIYLSGNEQAHRAESVIYRSKQAIAVQGEAAAGFFRNATPLSPRSPLPYTFLPARTPKELAEILAKAKLTILPSLWYETFGLTIIESILAGAIPIVSDLGAMQETIENFYGKSFGFDPRQALQDSNIQSLEVCIIDTLDSYESEFATLLQKREEIMQDLHSYAKKLINLYFYGGGGIITIELALLKLYALAHYLNSSFQFAPALPPQELKQILAKAKLSISPSLLNETFGLTIVESMLSSTPALVANRPELNTTAQRFGGFVFDDLEQDLQGILDKYAKYYEDFSHKRAQSIAYILSHPYPRELFALYLQGSSLV
ncbi:glycosyltransferase [Helicobacter sp. XJK30-2]|uniref:Glycosyltransferase n=1 Tax=Helicobacter zhangjianzhongii TaxID=2974574 RepID=A0ACC6FSF7_9HELI|nr:glycosyltransferase [Helicobacter sp. XJK30-2]MDL0082105.1 glycosyltransferase [Helicobacter sp. XJK30-2]